MPDDEPAHSTTTPCTCGHSSAADTVLTARQVAQLLGLDLKSVYAGVQRGEIPHRRVGRRLLFSQTAVLRWLTNEGRAVSERT